MMPAPDPNLIEREYLYFYPRNTILVSVAGSVLCIVGVVLAFIAQQPIFFWWGRVVCALVLTNTLMVCHVNLLKTTKLIITDDKLFLPSLWRSHKYHVMSFADIVGVNVIALQNGQTRVLRITGKDGVH